MSSCRPEHVEVLIVGAGLSGVGMAHQLQAAFPGLRYLILESRDAIGGTWDLFRYPGVRSDSDMQTLGYRFRPWTEGEAIAGGDKILRYVRDTAAEAGIDRRVRFGHRVVSAAWSSPDACWTVTVDHAGEQLVFTAGFLLLCSGYYRYDQGYLPEFEGIERFAGQVVHPQHWPADLDYAGKQVVVIGSGATAVTLVPALAATAAHVTMLQRSPTYVMAMPARDPIANRLRRVLGERAAYPIVRWKNIGVTSAIYALSRWRPAWLKALIRKGVTRQLPPDFDVDTHFAPRYDPWDQRLCLAPDGDLFRVLRAGTASVVTDRITTFTETGVQLASGQTLPADLVITATGLNLEVFGGIAVSVDGAPVLPSQTLAYKGVMLSGIPNFVFTVGYTNASWTLKADLVSDYACRLLRHMQRHGYRSCVPVDDDPTLTRRPLLDFAAGYIQRSLSELPSNGSKRPWQPGRNYVHDLHLLRHGRISDGTLRFSAGAAADSIGRQ